MRYRDLCPTIGVTVLIGLIACGEARAQVTVQVSDFVALPVTGSFSGGTGNPGSLARVNVMRPEPGPSGRLWVNDLNGPLYLLDPATRSFTTYLNFNGRDAHPGLFDRFTFAAGFANGLITFQFDPDYLTNGKFYTLHLEDPVVNGSRVPDATSVPGLSVDGYEPTVAETTPGALFRESVIIEWTDANIRNATFEGTAREILRIQLNTQIHPTGDLIFNPTARRGDPDWRVLYIGAGDGGSGEQKSLTMRHNPQRLDTLVGKILRIVPDPAEHQATSRLSPNGRYRIPRDNPFAGVAGARGEVWAYGFRNPHRLTWVVDAARPSNNRLLAMSIGMHTWETINIIHKGANYGYSEREGNEAMVLTNLTEPRPANDRLPVRVTDTVTRGTVAPTYPVLQYNHGMGLAILGGVLYQGSRLPALRGKFIFGDIATGRLYYAEYADLLNADDGKPDTMAEVKNISLRWDDPADTPDTGVQPFPTMNPIVVAGYEARKRATPGVQSGPRPTRADIRLAVDASGELYVLSKVDGMIRAVVAATAE